MWPLPRNPLIRYAVPLVAVAAAAAFHLALFRWSEQIHLALFVTAVVVSALYGGLGPGLLASALASVASAFFFLGPTYSFRLDETDLLRLGVFLVAALLISWLSGSVRRSEEALRQARDLLEIRVQERTAELVAANQELLAHQTKLQSLAAELSTAEERERRRIATVLHDAIGHALAVAVLKLRADPDIATPEQQHACELIEQAIQHTRSLTLQLSPPILYELGLGPAIEWLAEQFEKQHRLRIPVDDRLDEDVIDEEVRVLIFNAVRELLVNVVKHARAESASVAVTGDAGRILVTVSDDGVGFDPQAPYSPAGAFGLFNIRERLGHVGGSFSIESSPGRGCTVRLDAPLEVSGPASSVVSAGGNGSTP